MLSIPSPLQVKADNIPVEIKELRQWVLWRYEQRKDAAKPTKVPYTLEGSRASITDPKTWNDFEICLSLIQRFDGLGIVCANGIAGVDLDNHVDANGNISPFAQGIVDQMQSYTELSPSGRGLRILCYGELPKGRRREDSLGIEIYDTARFFTVTGHRVPKAPRHLAKRTFELADLHTRIFALTNNKAMRPSQRPAVPQDDRELLDRMFASKSGNQIKSLWAGDTSAHNSNDSAADLALCDHLAFWTQGDAARIDLLFRSSGLMRPKWDERHSGDGRTYGQMTIQKAITALTGMNMPFPNSHPGGELNAPVNMSHENCARVGVTPPSDEPAPRYHLHYAREALEPQPPIEWIIESLFSAGSVSLVVGEGGSKKTWSLLDAAVAVARGEQWLQFATQESPVLLIDEESGLRRLNRRFGDVMRGHSAGPEIPVSYTSLAQWNLAKPADVDELEKLIQASGARFVVIDALADVMLGADENSVKDVQPIFSNLRRISETTNCAIVIIHHSNKLGTYRGSTAIRGAVDLMLTVESKSGSELIKFKTDKVRDVAPMSFSARINFAPGIVNLSPAVTHIESKILSAAQEYVLRYLTEHGNSDLEKIIFNPDCCTREVAKKAVYQLANDGVIGRVDPGGKGKKAIYGILAPSPEQSA